MFEFRIMCLAIGIGWHELYSSIMKSGSYISTIQFLTQKYKTLNTGTVSNFIFRGSTNYPFSTY